MSTDGKPIDAITFAGNGEPTIHPDFTKIIGDTLLLRNKYYPNAKVAVLSNSMTLSNPDIRNALLRVDYNILKLDSGFDETIELLNQPKRKVTVAEIVSNLKQFKGNFTLQTMFVRGEYRGQQIDNTTEQELCRWLDIVDELQPKEVMIYTIARETPINTLKKIDMEELQGIAARVKALGIEVQVSG
jgi:wyosine [tRNA(Phe)-imidazoG37] synthetase (radical SAM superfamily)